jgi:ribosomal protein S18 acetylase RimI-like enzyme
MSKTDTETVSDIRNECLLGSQASLMAILESPSYILKVAELDGKVSGFIVYKNNSKKIKIKEFAVSPSFRRRGVASKLIGALVSKAKSTSKTIEVFIPEQNLAAQLLLKKCGLKASVSNKNSSYRFVTTKRQKDPT